MRQQCTHKNEINRNVLPKSFGCRECQEVGDTWIGLRMCLTCGNMGCCENSKNKHAAGHYSDTDHPLIQSADAGESWQWCYADQVYLKK